MSQPGVWIAIAIVAVLIVIALAYVLRQRRDSETLRSRFGTAYDDTVKEAGGNRARAEAELRRRAERVGQYDIHPLAAADRDRFSEDWRAIQSMFVDRPEEAVRRADKVIGEVMAARGYPVGDFEQRTSDISVGHGDVVRDYRIAHGLTIAHDRGESGTEDLRQAMVHYRTIFEELVNERPAARTVAQEERRDEA